MKKIKCIKQLKTEKKRIQQHQEDLEDKIRKDWKELKEKLKPLNFVKETFGSVINKKQEESLKDDSILKNTFTYGITLFAKKFADKAGEKLDKIFKK